MNMETPFFVFLEVGLFLVAAIGLYAKTRYLLIYGSNARSVLWVIACIIAFIGMGSLSNSAHHRSLKSAVSSQSQSFVTPSVWRSDLTAQRNENAGRSGARFNFIENGKINRYLTANGETVAFVPSLADIESRASKLASRIVQQKEANALLLKAQVWWFAWVPVLLLGLGSARLEYLKLVRFHNFSPQRNKFQTFAEIEGFAGLLMTACEQSDAHSTLETILSLPDEKRQSLLQTLTSNLRDKGAPKELTDAFVCLMDNDVAEKVYAYIHKCKR